MRCRESPLLLSQVDAAVSGENRSAHSRFRDGGTGDKKADRAVAQAEIEEADDGHVLGARS
jgi:hypothetical protein